MSDTLRHPARHRPRQDPEKRELSTRAKVVWWLVAITFTLAGFLAVIVAVSVHLGKSADDNIHRLPDPFPGVTDRPAPARRAQVWLLVGSDSRTGTSPAAWEVGAQRTDTIMLARIPDKGQATVVSIPRDSWVQIPGHGRAKINAAYSWGGPTLLIQTIEDLTDLHVDHYAVVDFAGFAAVTDALGGVNLDGHKNGAQALAWVRERKTLRHGDFDRIERQHAWLRQVLTGVTDKGLIDQAVRGKRVLNAITSAVAVDNTITGTQLRALVMSHPGGASFSTVPVKGTARRDKQAVVLLATIEDAKVWRRLGAHVKVGQS